MSVELLDNPRFHGFRVRRQIDGKTYQEYFSLKESGKRLRGAKRAAATFECGDALFQHRDRRVGDAAVDMPALFDVEQRRTLADAVEDVGSRLVNGHRARTVIALRNIAGVQCYSIGFEV